MFVVVFSIIKLKEIDVLDTVTDLKVIMNLSYSIKQSRHIFDLITFIEKQPQRNADTIISYYHQNDTNL